MIRAGNVPADGGTTQVEVAIDVAERGELPFNRVTRDPAAFWAHYYEPLAVSVIGSEG